MFQLFLRARAHNWFRTDRDDFRARSADRDAETDRTRVGAVLQAIDGALSAAEQEYAGLNRRVEDVLARAAVTLGNGTDEYLDRDPADSRHQDMLGSEISNGQLRLKELAVSLTHFRFLKAAMLSRFPDHSASNTVTRERSAH